MNYKKHYNQLIKKARYRSLTGYTETHHVVPTCMGGKDVRLNRVKLTPEEHYVAHLLLIKIHPGHKGLLWAAMQMTQGNKHQTQRKSNNKIYGWLRRRFGEMIRKSSTGRRATPEARARMSASRLGKKRKPHSEATKLKISLAAGGRPKSEEHKKSLSLAKLGKHPKRTKEHNQRIREGTLKAGYKISRVHKERYKSEEERKKTSEQMKLVWENRRAGKMSLPRGTSRVN